MLKFFRARTLVSKVQFLGRLGRNGSRVCRHTRQDRIHADGVEKYSVKELLCISDEEGPEASVRNKTRNRFGHVATDSELNRRKIERIPENTRLSTMWVVKVCVSYSCVLNLRKCIC
jgi:hypothetical protein